MLHVLLALINMSEVSCVIQSHPFDLANIVEEGLHGNILGLILRSIHEEGDRFYAA